MDHVMAGRKRSIKVNDEEIYSALFSNTRSIMVVYKTEMDKAKRFQSVYSLKIPPGSKFQIYTV